MKPPIANAARQGETASSPFRPLFLPGNKRMIVRNRKPVATARLPWCEGITASSRECSGAVHDLDTAAFRERDRLRWKRNASTQGRDSCSKRRPGISKELNGVALEKNTARSQLGTALASLRGTLCRDDILVLLLGFSAAACLPVLFFADHHGDRRLHARQAGGAQAAALPRDALLPSNRSLLLDQGRYDFVGRDWGSRVPPKRDPRRRQGTAQTVRNGTRGGQRHIGRSHARITAVELPAAVAPHAGGRLSAVGWPSPIRGDLHPSEPRRTARRDLVIDTRKGLLDLRSWACAIARRCASPAQRSADNVGRDAGKGQCDTPRQTGGRNRKCRNQQNLSESPLHGRESGQRETPRRLSCRCPTSLLGGALPIQRGSRPERGRS